MSEECSKCHDTGVIRESNGAVHTCYDCLQKGRLDVHSEKVPDSKIKI